MSKKGRGKTVAFKRERENMQQRIVAMIKFIYSEDFKRRSIEEKKLINQHLKVMQEYEKILNKRIDLIREERLVEGSFHFNKWYKDYSDTTAEITGH